MPTANITREEAQDRSRLVRLRSTEVHVDLTGRGVDDAERTFTSTTRMTFEGIGEGTTHVDLIGDAVRSAVLDGEELDVTGFDGYRFDLPVTPGEHVLEVAAQLRYSRSGEGLHRFVDPADDRVYLYTQFETADARRMYATFEQPDQKATFQLTVDAPAHWTMFSNAAAAEPEDLGDGFARWSHDPTPVLSTYLTALVAGEYHVVRSSISSAAGELPASVACRQSLAQHLDHERILTTTRRGFEVFEEAFDVPYAFGTYDQIFVPEYNFGAMENAGCVTFRDEYLFRSRVTARELEARDNTILHELAHMWFGDLVTMQWWDDLWLNESFAEWASHFAADEIQRRYGGDANPWASFSNERKAWAYSQDQYPTTHPIASDSSDLEKVEQNFDGITYAKGASVLKLLVSFVGQDAFLAGVSEYFKVHAWGNTVLADLLVQLEAASTKDLSWFADEWLETAGVNTLRADFDVADGRFTRFELVQTAHPDWPTLRTHRVGIGSYAGTGRRDHVEVEVSGERTSVDELIGREHHDVVLVNDGDLTYAKVRLDEASLAALRTPLDDPLARAVTWTALWDMTRDGELAAQDYVALVLAGLPTEEDPAACSALLNQARAAATAYTAPELRAAANRQLVAGLAALLKEAAPGSDKQVMLAKALIGAAQSPTAVALLRGWLDGEEVPEGLAIDTAMRWAIVGALARLGEIGADDVEAEREQHDDTSAGAEQAAGARAALPLADEKERAWRLATDEPELPNETHRQVCAGFWQYGQDFDYTDRYVELIDDISARRGSWADRGYAAIAAAVRGLFPAPLASQQLIERFESWLAGDVASQQVHRIVTERVDDARRALRAQRRSLED